MNSFLIRRLAPFFTYTILIEMVVFVILLFSEHKMVDFSFLSMVKTIGVLFLTSCVSFLYMMLPYTLYLLILPQKRINGRLDHFISIFMFFVYVYVTLFEETTSIIFWDEFSASFNFIAVDYLIYTHEVIRSIYHSYPVVWFLLGLLVATVLIVATTYKYLFTNMESPKFGRRLFYTSIYVAFCALTFINVDINNLQISKNRFNNELSKESVYSLFSAFWKSELPYNDFYLTNDKTKNLKILQKELASPEAEFISPKNTIRSIDYDKRSKKYNIILVMMENMSAKFLNENRPAGTMMLTPNLSKLSQESLFFPNTYATGTRAVRGVEAITLSVPPLPGMSIVRRPDNDNLHGLGDILQSKGYDNKWIYGGYGVFDNLNGFFKHNGFKTIDRIKWEKEDVHYDNLRGASDEDVLTKIIKEADKSYLAEKPFLTMAMTLSNHSPYSFPEGRIDLAPRKSKRQGGVKYADYAIGKFIEEAKQKPWFDNTIFVFVANRAAGASQKDDLQLQNFHIPMMFYAPKIIHPQRIDTPVSQIDATPTLLGILKMEYDSRFYGKDILQKGYTSRLFINNNQKLGYVKKGVEVVLSPVKEYSATPKRSPFAKKYLDEAIAYYQEASDWKDNFKKEAH